MSRRVAHGRASALGRLTASEPLPWDEQPAASPSGTDRSERTPDGRFAAGNGVARSRRLRSGHLGALAALEAQGDDAARAALRWGRRYGAHRRRELAQAHGGTISAGVGLLVETAAHLTALGRYWAARSVAEGNADHARLAAQLAAQARGAERDAWELGSREAAVRREQKTSAPIELRLPPWLAAPEEPPR